MTGCPSLPDVNPLLEGLAPFIPFSRVPEALLNEPLQFVPWRTMTPELREQFLASYKQHFFPTSFGIDVVTRIQIAVRHGLDLRDPRSPAEQKRINQVLMVDLDHPDILPSLTNPAMGGIIDGWTGSGKSSLVTRVLNVIAPDQIIRHPKSKACGWSTLMQITYLYLDFPSNGTRGGLVARILGAIDALIGTNYVERSRRLRNLDSSLIFVMQMLSMHRIGVLVIDEGQPETLDRSPWHRELVQFFLALLNLGIPVILCGQPRAFENFQRSAQVSRRFCEIGHFELRRADSDTHEWWRKEFVRGMMRFSLCEQVLDRDEIMRESRHTAAGVPGYFARQWIEAQRIALRKGGSKATLGLSDFHAGAQSPEIAKIAKAARWLEAGGPDDFEYDDLERRPMVKAAAVSSPTVAQSEPPRQPPSKNDVVDQLRGNLERRTKQGTVARNCTAKLAVSADPDDLRFNRAINILAGLEKSQKDLPLTPPEGHVDAQEDSSSVRSTGTKQR